MRVLFLSVLAAAVALISQSFTCAQENSVGWEYRLNLPLVWNDVNGDSKDAEKYISTAAIEASGLAFTKSGDLYVLCEKLSAVLRFRPNGSGTGDENPFRPAPDVVPLIDKDGKKLNPELEAISILEVVEGANTTTRAYVCDEKALKIFEYKIDPEGEKIQFEPLRTITIPRSDDPMLGVNSSPVPATSSVAKGIEGMIVFQERADAPLSFYLLDEQDQTSNTPASYVSRIYRGSLAPGDETIMLDGRPHDFDHAENSKLRMTELTTKAENGSVSLHALRSNYKTAYDLVELDMESLGIVAEDKIVFSKDDDKFVSTNFEGAAFSPVGELFLVTDSGAADVTAKPKDGYTRLGRYIGVQSQPHRPSPPLNPDVVTPEKNDPHVPNDTSHPEVVQHAVASDSGVPFEVPCAGGVPCEIGVPQLRLPAVNVHNRQTVPMSKRMAEIWMTFPDDIKPSVSVNFVEYPFEGRVRVFRSHLRSQQPSIYYFSAGYWKDKQWIKLVPQNGYFDFDQQLGAHYVTLIPGSSVPIRFAEEVPPDTDTKDVPPASDGIDPTVPIPDPGIPGSGMSGGNGADKAKLTSCYGAAHPADNGGGLISISLVVDVAGVTLGRIGPFSVTSLPDTADCRISLMSPWANGKIVERVDAVIANAIVSQETQLVIFLLLDYSGDVPAQVTLSGGADVTDFSGSARPRLDLTIDDLKIDSRTAHRGT